jgi:hypothetical protein
VVYVPLQAITAYSVSRYTTQQLRDDHLLSIAFAISTQARLMISNCFGAKELASLASL